MQIMEVLAAWGPRLKAGCNVAISCNPEQATDLMVRLDTNMCVAAKDRFVWRKVHAGGGELGGEGNEVISNTEDIVFVIMTDPEAPRSKGTAVRRCIPADFRYGSNPAIPSAIQHAMRRKCLTIPTTTVSYTHLTLPTKRIV